MNFIAGSAGYSGVTAFLPTFTFGSAPKEGRRTRGSNLSDPTELGRAGTLFADFFMVSCDVVWPIADVENARHASRFDFQGPGADCKV